uniref:NADH-ubiquinone oxidoreductase chain 5 n=1 Tax=Tetrastichus howardi TaxID=2848231 RepID=A0A8F5GDU2_9HYME|nr:NADH dehydrogenase subunit 5 [Tetrastichus howardi]QXM14788.1 NADH dehydrogenase subunit 5 [Tetrastichus howardi]
MLLYYISSILFFMISLNSLFFSLMFLMKKMNLFIEWYLIYLNSLSMNMYIYIDWMTLMFIFTVMLISSMIMLYSIEYMNHDLNKIRFFWILSFFILFMLLMVISPNIMMILIGWDGLGLTSYCLIIFYQSKSSYNSGMLTFLINRMGDIFIIMSISMMLNFGSWNLLNFNKLNYFIMIMIILAAMTKSAQFPFSSWLPAAMAAPTPVSSLVHSSTLVTAGIYMLIRFHYLIMLFNNLIKFILMIGLITMFMASMSAIMEFDLKKIIAYSTLSQLGLMMMILGFNYPNLAFFHLVIHAMFKSMMFMCSGIIIHSMSNYQDIRFIGKMKNYLPLTMIMMMISNFSLCGMPFFSGFYSKDLILENMFMLKNNFFIFILLLLSTMLTVMYSFRLSYYLMNNNLKFIPMFLINEFKMMNYPMMILMFMSMMSGMMLNWLIYNNIENIFLLKIEKLMIFMICIFGLMMSLLIYKIKIFLKKLLFLKFFLGKMWFLYYFNYIIIINFLKFGKMNSLMFDKGWSEELFKNNILIMSNKMKFMNYMNLNYLIYMIMILIYIFMFLFLLN